ncbi:MAG: hypothetical protein ABI779_07670 [Acidobacteriota bacterium]
MKDVTNDLVAVLDSVTVTRPYGWVFTFQDKTSTGSIISDCGAKGATSRSAAHLQHHFLRQMVAAQLQGEPARARRWSRRVGVVLLAKYEQISNHALVLQL